MRKLLILAAVAVVLFAGTGAPTRAEVPGPPAHPHQAGEILVGMKPGTPGHAARGLGSSLGATVLSQHEEIGVLRLAVPVHAMDAVISALERNPNVEFAEPNFIAATTDGPNDPGFEHQWALQRVQAPQAWNVTTSAASIRVAILDTGIDTTHPDLADKVVAEVNFSSSPTAMDVSGHGTHVAGIVGAVTNNAEGVASIGYEASLVNVKVMGDQGFGTYGDVIDGITWASRNNVHVINMSFGGSAPSKALERAVNQASKRGVLLFAAAGNSGSSSPFYPAAYPKVIGVAATNTLDQLSSFSNHGDWISIGAPGNLILSTVIGGGYDYKAGTSMAAPHVAGLAALMLTQTPDAAATHACILSSADDLGLPIGGGRMNAANAVQCEYAPDSGGGGPGNPGRGKPR